MLAGWAADLDATVDRGVDTGHVWAYPATGDDPIWIGAATYGSLRELIASTPVGDRFLSVGPAPTGPWELLGNTPAPPDPRSAGRSQFAEIVRLGPGERPAARRQRGTEGVCEKERTGCARRLSSKTHDACESWASDGFSLSCTFPESGRRCFSAIYNPSADG